MQLELNANELEVLLKLIQLEMEEINPEIRRASPASNMRKDLREEREVLHGLLSRLNEAATKSQQAEPVWP